MGSQLSQDVVRNALDYWYERNVYTSTLSLAPGASSTLFPLLASWNPPTGARQVVSLETIAASQDPSLRLQITYDGLSSVVLGDDLPPDLKPVRVSAPAASSLGLTAVNQGTVQEVGTQVLYGASIWAAPVSYKVLHGYGLTQEDLDLAKKVGLKTNPVQSRGTHPIPISAVIERTYANRMTQSPYQFQGPSPQATTQGAVFAQVNANPPGQDLLVLRYLAAECDEDYGVTITLDRDNQIGHTTWDVGLMSLDRPLDLFIAAKSSLTFHIQAGQAPPGPVPVRFEVWHVSLTAILRLRMGLMSEAAAQGLYGSEAGANLYARVLTGVV